MTAFDRGPNGGTGQIPPVLVLVFVPINQCARRGLLTSHELSHLYAGIRRHKAGREGCRPLR